MLISTLALTIRKLSCKERHFIRELQQESRTVALFHTTASRTGCTAMEKKVTFLTGSRR